MVSKGYIKRKRKLIDPYSIVGFTFRNSLYHVEVLKDAKGNETEANVWGVDLWITFFWPGCQIILHSNTDVLEKSFESYYNKLLKIKDICSRSLDHLLTGKGPKVNRDFLNDEKDNDGYGGTLFITGDPDDKDNYCVFEISSCYKKYRHGTNPKGMIKYLKSVLSFMDIVFTDLDLIKSKIEEVKVDDQRLLQSGGKTEGSNS